MITSACILKPKVQSKSGKPYTNYLLIKACNGGDVTEIEKNIDSIHNTTDGYEIIDHLPKGTPFGIKQVIKESLIINGKRHISIIYIIQIGSHRLVDAYDLMNTTPVPGENILTFNEEYVRELPGRP